MASTSAKFWMIALPPISSGVDHSRRKWRPSTAMSVVTTVREFGGALKSTAASSPLNSEGAWVTISRITAFSPSSATVGPVKRAGKVVATVSIPPKVGPGRQTARLVAHGRHEPI